MTKLCGEIYFPIFTLCCLNFPSSSQTNFYCLFFSEVFCGKNGDVLKENETIKFTKLAETYRTIAEKGAEEFYVGQTAENLVRDIQAAGRII